MPPPEGPPGAAQRPGRSDAIDILKALAIVLMLVQHTVPGHDLAALSHDRDAVPGRAGLQGTRVLVPEGVGEQRGELLPDQGAPRVPEEALGRCVGVADRAGRPDHEDGVRKVLEQRDGGRAVPNFRVRESRRTHM